MPQAVANHLNMEEERASTPYIINTRTSAISVHHKSREFYSHWRADTVGKT